MPYTPCFTEVCRAIKADADEMELHLSGRKIKHIAGQYMQHQRECADDRRGELAKDNEKNEGQLSYNSLSYKDETGNLAIHNWFAQLVRDSQDPYEV